MYLSENYAECLPLYINMQFLVNFRAPWNKQGRCMLSGTGGSGFKSKDLLPILTSCDYQGLNDQVIEEVNSSISCWISFVASTAMLENSEPHFLLFSELQWNLIS